MNVQHLERNADVRIKFAAINQFGGLESDANQEYVDLFTDFRKDWKLKENVGYTNDKSEWVPRSWVLQFKDRKTEIAAVEHETGIEILIGITSGLAVEAIVEFTKWAWKKWKALTSIWPEKNRTVIGS